MVDVAEGVVAEMDVAVEVDGARPEPCRPVSPRRGRPSCASVDALTSARLVKMTSSPVAEKDAPQEGGMRCMSIWALAFCALRTS